MKDNKVQIGAKEHASIAEFITNSLKTREQCKYRKKHETLWKEVDRQIYMESMSRMSNNPDVDGDWRSALELGEISRASEVLSADINRLTFPQNRSWFDPHTKLDDEIDEETGEVIVNEKLQKRMDGQLRACMAQQHIDFGLKSRQALSIKEALHHGSYVVEVVRESLLKVKDGSKIQQVSAPVWVPHSMWNCYPDPAQSILGTNMFYNGSMIIKSAMSYNTLKTQKAKGWFNLDQIKPKKMKEADLCTYFGDITITAEDGKTIFLPNSKAIVADKILVYYMANPLPMPEIIYNGYEKLDVRDPYHISPLVKMAPTQKIASILMNNFIDILERHSNPATGYDGSDPDLAKNGGPDVSPGATNPMRSPQSIFEFKLGDPSAALNGVQFMMGELQKGTSVDSIRSGMSSGAEQTATEVERTRQGGQIRTVDFVDKHESHGLRPFLYLQHEMNKANPKFEYYFYNQEMDAPDFEGISEVPEQVHFDVVGSKGLVEEERRQSGTMQVTTFLMSVAPQLVNIQAVAKEMYMDVGNKNPETFLNISDPIQEMQQQFQEQIDNITNQAQEAIGKLEQQIAEMSLSDEEHDVDVSTLQNSISIEKLKKEQAVNAMKEAQIKLRLMEEPKPEPKEERNESMEFDSFKKDITGMISDLQKSMKPEKQEKQPIIINNNIPKDSGKSIKIKREGGKITGAEVDSDD